MNLTETPEVVSWPETHYAFVEKTWPFPNIAPRPGKSRTVLCRSCQSRTRSSDI